MELTRPAPAVTHELCDALAAAADALVSRRASEIAESDREDFIALGWMEWHGGTLRLTMLGQMALVRIRTRMHQEAA